MMSWLWDEVDEAGLTPLDLQKAALTDSIDLVEAEVLLLFTGDDESVPRAAAVRGGRHVEFGMAVGWGLKVVLVGPRENVFHWMPEVSHVEEWGQDVIDTLGSLDTLAEVPAERGVPLRKMKARIPERRRQQYENEPN